MVAVELFEMGSKSVSNKKCFIYKHDIFIENLSGRNRINYNAIWYEITFKVEISSAFDTRYSVNQLKNYLFSTSFLLSLNLYKITI